MARNYAQVRVSIWQDDDFRTLPVEAQHLYFLLLTSPTLNLAGVSDWRPERIASLADNWTPDDVRDAAYILGARRYILTDESTEEVLVRTLVKHDGILRNPKTAVGMVSAWTGTYSKRLRAAVAGEVQKLADGVSESVRRVIAPLLDYQSDWVSDDQSAGVSVLVSLPPQPQPQPATSNLQPSELRPDVADILDHLDRCIIANGAKKPSRTKGNLTAARLLIDRDGKTVDEIHRVINWATSDSFWRSNILSMSKLRAKWDQLYLKSTNARPASRGNLTEWEADFTPIPTRPRVVGGTEWEQ